MGMAEKSLFCFGYGYCCDYLGYALQNMGHWQIAGTTRDPEKRTQMKKRGIKSYVFDYEKPLNDPHFFLEHVTHILISTPPNDDGDPTFVMHGEDIARMPALQWVGYLSSTSIYGDREGRWVDEKSEPRPNSRRGSRRLRAEEQWLSLYEQNGLPVHIFRLAGIYGPGRSALDSVRTGTARIINKPGHVFNRVHVEDIIQVLLASMHNPAPGEIYNICDDEAAPSNDVIEYACRLLGFAPPPAIPYNEADMAPIARSFYNDNKRVKNDKIKAGLGVNLHYPTYREGLQGCLKAEDQSAQQA